MTNNSLSLEHRIRKSSLTAEAPLLILMHGYVPVGHGVAPQNFYELKDWLSKRI